MEEELKEKFLAKAEGWFRNHSNFVFPEDENLVQDFLAFMRKE